MEKRYLLQRYTIVCFIIKYSDNFIIFYIEQDYLGVMPAGDPRRHYFLL
jgi:hypothetical protein